MKLIHKGTEPARLREYRSDPFATYDGYPAKGDLRAALAEEQGAICCYCMSRISPSADGMKIEHWAAQSTDEGLQLAYPNMLGACKGGEGNRREEQHCHTHKGSDGLTINPTHPSCEQSIKYSGAGEIASSDPRIHRDLCETLNLNMPRLKNNRKAVLDALIEGISRKYGAHDIWREAVLRKEIARWQSRSDGKYHPYCQVALYRLERWLRARTDRHQS
jgi:uncharacterized protein (TIGR02646 family)